MYLIDTGKISLTPIYKRYAVFIAYAVMFIFCGLRGHINTDFISYYPYFENLPNIFHLTPSRFLDGRFEPGFQIYTSLFKTVIDNYFAWIAFNTLIDLIVLHWFFKKYSYSAILPLIFFAAFRGLGMEFNLLRNMKAIDLFLLSIPFLLEKKPLPYFLLNLLGLTFHSSSILFFPIYFLLNLYVPKYVVWGLFILSNLIFVLDIKIINTIMEKFTFLQLLEGYDRLTTHIQQAEQSKFGFGYLERAITFAIFFLNYNKLLSQNKYNQLFLNSYLIFYFTFNILYEVEVLVGRVPALFYYSYWILYPAVLKVKNIYRQIIHIIAYSFVLLRLYSNMNYKFDSYQNILFGHDDYYVRKEMVLKEIN